MTTVIAILLLWSACALAQDKQRATLYLAVMDKGPSTPPTQFLVDNDWTLPVKKNQFVVVPIEPGIHQINIGWKDNRDKKHKRDMEISVEAGQSRYFVMEMEVDGLWQTRFKLSELKEQEWKFRMPKLKERNN